jgi:hypothetical protein
MKSSNDRRSSVHVVILVFLLISVHTKITSAGELIELCDFKVPDSIANANASFSVVYSIEIDPSGKVVKVTKVKNEFLSDAPFVACLRTWQLPPEYGTVSVIFNWTHGKGWTQMSLTGKGVERVLKFQPGWCAK